MNLDDPAGGWLRRVFRRSAEHESLPVSWLPWLLGPLLVALLLVQYTALGTPLWREGLWSPTLGGLARGARGFLVQLGLAALLRGLIALIASHGHAWRPVSWRDIVRYLWDVAWVAFALAVFSATYTWTKLFLPAFGGMLWDERLAAFDVKFHLGINPNVFALAIFESGPKWAAKALDLYYAGFVYTMLVGVAWFLADLRRSRRLAFAFSLALLWSAGLLGYVAMPTLGPAFAVHDLGRQIAAVFPLAAQLQKALAANYTQVLFLLDNPGKDVLVTPGFGVAAMPSLHVAGHAFLFLWAYLIGSRLRAVLLAMTILTFLGSVATGWHYAVDSWAGLLLAIVAGLVAQGLLRRAREKAPAVELC